MNETLTKAVNMAVMLLGRRQSPTAEEIEDVVGTVVRAMGMFGPVDPEELRRNVEACVNVKMGKPTVIDGCPEDAPPDAHRVWLPNRRGEVQWRFWERYKWYLEYTEGLGPKAVGSIDEVTDLVLERLEDPNRPGQWDRRGMVVGDVQSGKTGNYLGLICKAADAGYRAIIILAGLHNNLRAQTQERVDVGFLGWDTEKNLSYDKDAIQIGVGQLPQKEFQNLRVCSLTFNKPTGDFRKAQAEAVGIVEISNDPTIFVVKKNKTPLKNLCNWLEGRTRDAAVLVIDDEADNASVNTAPIPGPNENWEEYDPTTINREIRRLLLRFKRRAYVGYTATPFANVFIHPDSERNEFIHPDSKKREPLGPDLFPSAFIINMPTPSDHVGAALVFGLEEDRAAGISKTEGLPIVRKVMKEEAEAFLPPKHRKDSIPAELPGSLRRAIKSFVLACAVRGCRGQGGEHQSMLIHVTRYVQVQNYIVDLIANEIADLASALRVEGHAFDRLMSEFRQLWVDDFVPTMAGVAEARNDPLMTQVGWAEVDERLRKVASRIVVRAVNGEVSDIKEYRETKDGFYAILVGGDKLSRGLTLPGLTVSYFLRTSRMYDTLMQMGRWFGYRPGYLDVCRLYTTPELIDWYRHIAMATIELRQDFEYMHAIGASPRDFGLRVRQHPAGLMVTAAGKMRAGEDMQVTFADTLAETTVFDLVGPAWRKNLSLLGRFVEELGTPESEPGVDGARHLTWRNVQGHSVVEFLRQYDNHRDSRRSRPDLLADFIREQIEIGELTTWHIALYSMDKRKSDPRKGISVTSDITIGIAERANASEDDDGSYRMSKSHVISRKDEFLDLSEEERAKALQKTLEVWSCRAHEDGEQPPTEPSGKGARNARPPERGLLLLYLIAPDVELRQEGDPVYTAFGLSFPASEKAKTVAYKVFPLYDEAVEG